MPMYGIQKPDRATVEKQMHAHIKLQTPPVVDRAFYQSCIETLWALPHREEKYLAIDFALHYKDQISWDNLPVYTSLILHDEFMWWDFVDPIAVNLIGKVALLEQAKIEPLLRQWIDDEQHMWLRRTALLAQLKHKKQTKEDLLFEFCRKRMHEKEFFIRKAIGWVLREYGKTSPESVVQFLQQEKANLSGLSYREGSRILIKNGYMT
eukprot:Sro68_g038000.2  (208) ;mRNA; f:36700-37323